ncbi:MAG: ankyrin repeat domain-containing protein [Endozoicomonadaceae bacterium]|nr:ankyrin repeat domain-containing protein [Endozoicomonadaceae bacterium]
MEITFSKFDCEQYIKYRELTCKLRRGSIGSRFFSAIGVFFRGKKVILSEDEKDMIRVENNRLYNKLKELQLLDRKVSVFFNNDLYNDGDVCFYDESFIVNQETSSNTSSSNGSLAELDTEFLQIDDQHRKENLSENEDTTEILDDGNPLTETRYPLNLQVNKHRRETIKLLLESGASSTGLSDNGTTFFSMAVETGDTKIVKTFLKQEADINCIEKVMPFFRAIRNKNYEMIHYLLKKGTNINKVGGSGNNALGEAVKINDLKMAKFLLSNGSRIDIGATIDDFALSIAISTSNCDMVRMFMSQYETNNLLYGGWIDARESVMVEPASLRNSGNEINYKFLNLGIVSGNLDMVRLLLNIGADRNGVINKQTPLALAVEKNNIDIVKILLKDKEGIDINFGYKISQEKTPLEVAAMSGNCPMMSFLIDKGARINYSSSFHLFVNPLICAIRGGHFDAVCLLLSKGANIYEGVAHCWDMPASCVGGPQRNFTAIEEASEYGHRHILRQLMVYSSQYTESVEKEIRRQCCRQAIWLATLNNNLGIIKDLCAYAYIEIENLVNSSLLLKMAAKKRYHEIVLYLLMKNVEVNDEAVSSLINDCCNIKAGERVISTLVNLSIIAFVKGNGITIKYIASDEVASLLPNKIISMIKDCGDLCPVIR